MDRITSQLLQDFTRENDLASLPEDKQFEHFSAEVTIGRHYGEVVPTPDVVTGEGNDTGIDAVGIIVNGTLVTDPDQVDEIVASSRSLDIIFVFVQAERSSHFDAAKIGTFGVGVRDFFSQEPTLQRNHFIKDAAAIADRLYAASGKFNTNPSCVMYYVTSGRWADDANLLARKHLAEDSLRETNLFGAVELIPIGAEDIQRLRMQNRNAVEREFTFTNKTVIPDISGVTEAYIGIIPAKDFLNLIEDSAGGINKALFYDNIRDWQDYNDVNNGIKSTILDPEARSRFVLMNNGVTIVAKKLRVVGNKYHIQNYQVVNGCQTSHVLWFNRAQIDDSVMIPLRLISTVDDAITSSIIVATNSQTEISEEQLHAISQFQKNLEVYFSTFDASDRLYYERRSRQYEGDRIEKTRVISPTNLIKAYASMFLNQPDRTTKNYRVIRALLGNSIFGKNHRLEPYYVAALAHYRLEFLFRNRTMDSKYKAARYHLLLALRVMLAPNNPPQPNANQVEAYCRPIIDALVDNTASQTHFAEAARIVERASNGNLDRDNVRTQSFTDNLLAYLR